MALASSIVLVSPKDTGSEDSEFDAQVTATNTHIYIYIYIYLYIYIFKYIFVMAAYMGP